LRQQKRERLSTPSEPAEFVFFYPADGSPHKNQRNLLDAWALLARAGWYPTLQLTLSGREWEALQEGGAHQSAPSPSIVNLGRLSRDDALATMRAASALVFPSTLESFGLPLVEARALGVPIVASERDFVRDVCDPVQTFDPSSPRSIAAAVARFMMCQASREHDYYSAERLIDLLKR
jgi:glycosyltransferase involved in cell wall biosynthesis